MSWSLSRRLVLAATGLAAALAALAPALTSAPPATAAPRPAPLPGPIGPGDSFPVGSVPFRLRFLPLDATMVPWWGGTDPGSIVRLWPGPSSGDAWRAVARGVLPFGDGRLTVFGLVNDRSSLCLTPRDPRMADGTKLQLEPCVPGERRQEFVAVPQAVTGRPGPAFVLRDAAALDHAVGVGNRSWHGSDLAWEISRSMPPGPADLAWSVEPAR